MRNGRTWGLLWAAAGVAAAAAAANPTPAEAASSHRACVQTTGSWTYTGMHHQSYSWTHSICMTADTHWTWVDGDFRVKTWDRELGVAVANGEACRPDGVLAIWHLVPCARNFQPGQHWVDHQTLGKGTTFYPTSEQWAGQYSLCGAENTCTTFSDSPGTLFVYGKNSREVSNVRWFWTHPAWQWNPIQLVFYHY